VDDDYNFQPGELEANTYLQTTHKWEYNFLTNAWAGAMMYQRAKNIKIDNKLPAIEVYDVWPMHEDKQKKYITHIWMPKK
jgi:hypothetical protein